MTSQHLLHSENVGRVCQRTVDLVNDANTFLVDNVLREETSGAGTISATTRTFCPSRILGSSAVHRVSVFSEIFEDRLAGGYSTAVQRLYPEE